MGTESYTRTLAAFATATDISDLSASTRAAARRVMLDTLGCAVGGRVVDSSRIVGQVRVAQGGAAEATVLGGGERLPVATAAYVNAHCANALDAEETILHSGHLAACVVPPALAVAEHTQASGADLLAAVAIGFDVAARIGLSLRHIDILDDGTIEIAPVAGLSWAAFASTVAAARMFGLDADQMAQAFGVTVASAPLPIAGRWGRLASPRPMTKYGMYGAMAEAGVLAAQLVRAGFVGDATVLDGERGFWRMMGSRRCAFDQITDRLGDRWLVEETSFKLYPACRFSTPALDLFYQLSARAGVAHDEIDRVEVYVPHAMLAKHMDSPAVVTVVDGQFSLPHGIALAATQGPPGPAWHSTATTSDPRVAEFARRVEVHEYPEASGIMEEQIREKGHSELIPTRMVLHARGKAHEEQTEHATGDPWADGAAIDDDTLADKFRLFCAPLLDEDKIDRAMRLLARIEDEPTVTPLVAALIS